VDKESNLKNRVRIEMDQLNFVIVKEQAEEVAGWEAKSMLEEGGEHHNLIRIGCWDVFPSGRTSLQHRAVQEKVIRNKLAVFTLIHDGWLEKVWMRGGHGWGEGSQ
jgi:hypothetical protein